MSPAPGQRPPRRPTTARPSPRTVAAVLSRDLTCTFPGCAVPAFRCDLDHLVPPVPGPERAGGSAHQVAAESPANLIALCRHHRVLRARAGWRPTLLPDGSVRWTAPSGHNYVRPSSDRTA